MADHRTVLAVDDEESILLSLQRILELSGDFEVITASSANEAWQIITKQLPDLVLLDIAMPGTDGIEFCKMIRSNELTRNLPVIFLTAKSDRLIEGFKAGGDDFIVKPFNFDEVIVKIEALFRRMRNLRELATQIRGNLAEYSLDDLLQMCHDKSITGSIVFYNGQNETATVSVEKGELKEIRYKNLSEARALDAIRLWDEGMFVIRPTDFRFKLELMKKKVPSAVRPEFNDSIQIGEQIWWTGHRDMENRVQVNTYLRKFEHEEQRINLAIDAGPSEYFASIKSKTENLIGTLKNLQILVLTNPETEWNRNWQKFQEFNDRLIFVTNREHLKRFIPFGINVRHVKLIDSLKNNRLKLVTGHRLQFINIPFCPEPGSFMMYDPQTRILFSGLMFGSNLEAGQYNRLFALESDWDAVRQYHQERFATGKCLQYAIEAVNKLEPKPIMIAPQFGLVWRETVIQRFFQRLRYLNTGLDLQMNRLPYDEVLKIIQAGNQLLQEAAKLIPASQMESKIENDALLMAHCVFKENRIVKIVGLPQLCLSRLISTLISGEDVAIMKQIQLFARGAARAFQVENYLEKSSEPLSENDLFGEES